MIDRFKDSFKEIKIINLQDINIIGDARPSALSYDIPIYQGKDGFVELHNTQIKTADILVFAVYKGQIPVFTMEIVRRSFYHPYPTLSTSR